MVPPPILNSQVPPAFLRRLDLAKQGNAVAAGKDLERHRQHAVLRIPVELELGVLDWDAAFVVVGLADRTGLGNDVTEEVLRQAVGAYFAVHRRRQRQVDAQISVVEPRGQQELARRNAARLQLNLAITLAGRRGGGREHPWPRRVGRADADFDAAAVQRASRSS